jgi:hypothetical protein
MLDLSQFTPEVLDQIPDRPLGNDRLVATFVFDRPDPEGPDQTDDAAMDAAFTAFSQAVCDLSGTNPATGLHTLLAVENTETTAQGVTVAAGLPAT